jgi:hypothetical protein
MVKGYPFKESPISPGSDESVLRIFQSDIDSEELKWHWDDEDRIVYLVGETDWMFQYDNQLPIIIPPRLEIKKGTWHRLIKGTEDLRLVIEKHRDI